MLRFLIRAVLFSVVFFVICEVFFRCVLVASEPPNKIFLTNEKLTVYDNIRQADGVYAVGNFNQIITHWHVNNMGMISKKNYYRSLKKCEVAIIGDSNIEGLFIRSEDHIATVLDSMLQPDYEVCSFGLQGSNIAQYIKMMAYAKAKIDPVVFVLVMKENEFFSASADLQPNPHYAQYRWAEDTHIIDVEPLPFTRDSKTRILRTSALVRYLSINRRLIFLVSPELVFNDDKDEKARANIDREKYRKKIQILNAICQRSLQQIASVAANKTVIFLCDVDRPGIYNGTWAKPSLTYNLLMGQTLSSNFQTIDLSKDFNEDYAKHHIPFNYDIDLHFNQYGNRLLARIVCSLIKENQSK